MNYYYYEFLKPFRFAHQCQEIPMTNTSHLTSIKMIIIVKQK